MLKEHLKKHFKRIRTIRLKRHHYILGGFGIAAIIALTSIFGFQKIGTHAALDEDINCVWYGEDTPLIGINVNGSATLECTSKESNGRTKNFKYENAIISGNSITGEFRGEPIEFTPTNGGNGITRTFRYRSINYGTSYIIMSGAMIVPDAGTFRYNATSAPIVVKPQVPTCSISATRPILHVNETGTITVNCSGEGLNTIENFGADSLGLGTQNIITIGNISTTQLENGIRITYEYTGSHTGETAVRFKENQIYNQGGGNNNTPLEGGIKVTDKNILDCIRTGEDSPITKESTGSIILECPSTKNELTTNNIEGFVDILSLNNAIETIDITGIGINDFKFTYKGNREGIGKYLLKGETASYSFNVLSNDIEVVSNNINCVIAAIPNEVKLRGDRGIIDVSCEGNLTNTTQELSSTQLEYSGEIINIDERTNAEYIDGRTHYYFQYQGIKRGITKVNLTGGSITNGIIQNDPILDGPEIIVYDETECERGNIYYNNPISINETGYIELICTGDIQRNGNNTDYNDLWEIIHISQEPATRLTLVLSGGTITLSGNTPTTGRNILKVGYTGKSIGTGKFLEFEGKMIGDDGKSYIKFTNLSKSEDIVVELGKPTCTITGETPKYIGTTGIITVSCTGKDLESFNITENSLIYNSEVIKVEDEFTSLDYTATFTFLGQNTGHTNLGLTGGIATNSTNTSDPTEFEQGIWIIEKDKVTCNRELPEPNLIQAGDTGTISFTCTGTNDSYTGDDFTGVEINYNNIANYIGISGNSIATINTGISDTGITLTYTGLRGGISNYLISGETTTQVISSELSNDIIVREYTGLCSISANPERVEIGSGGKITISCQEPSDISPILYRSGLEYDSGIISIMEEYVNSSNGTYEFSYQGDEAGLSEIILKAGQIIANGVWMNNQVQITTSDQTDGIVVYSKANCERGNVYPSNPLFVDDTGFIELICTGKIDWTNSNKTTYNELRGIIRADDQDGALETGNIILSGDNPTEGRNVLKVNFTGEVPGTGRFSIDGPMGNEKSGQIMFTDNQTRSTGIVVQYKKPTCTIEGDNVIYIDSTGEIIVTCTGHGNELIGTISRSELNYNNIIEIISEQTGTESAIFIYKGNNTGHTDVTLDSGVVSSNGERNDETEFEEGVTVKDKEQITCTWSGESTPINVNETGDIELKCTGDINEVLTTGTIRDFVTLSGNSIEANSVELIARTEIEETFKFSYTGDHGGISNFVISGETADSIIGEKTSENIYVISDEGFACTITAEPDTVKPRSGGKIKVDCPDEGTYNMTELSNSDLIYSDIITVSSTSQSITSDKDFIFLYTGEQLGHTELKLRSGVIIKDNIYYNIEKEYSNGITVRNETECSRGNGQEVNEGEAGYLTLTCTGLLGNNISTNENVNLNNLRSIITKDGNSIETGNITAHNYNPNGTNTLKVHFTGISQGTTKLNISGTIDENFYISDNGVTTGIVYVLGDKPECSIRAEPDIIPIGLSGIIKIECGGTNLGDIAKANIDYSGAIISILESSVPAVQNGTSSIYTFHYTGEQVGRTKLGLKTGAVHNGTVQNDYAESEYGIYVMENSHLECRRTDLTNNAIEIRGTGKITLDCGRSGDDSVKHPEKRILRLVETVNDTGKIAFTTGLSFAQGINFTGIEVGSTHFYLSGNLNEYITVRAGESEEIKVYAQNGIQTGCTWGTPVPNQITIGQTGKINLNCNNITINTETPNEMWDIIDLDNEPNNEIIINTGNIRIIENENKIEFEYEGNHTGTTKLFASGSYGGMYIESTNRSTPIKVIDSSKPLCTISGDTIVGLLGTGEIRVICYDINGITTTQLNSGALEYTDEISVGNSTIVGGTEQEKTFTFTFTGSHTGTTAIAIRTGKVLNTLNDGNDYTTGENIKVVDSYTCHRETPQPQILSVEEIGTMTLECGLLHVNTIDENIGSILIRSGDSVTGNLNNFVLSYTGERTGTTNFAISGIIQGIIVKTEPLRSSGITVYPANTNMILSISPESSIFNNQIIVHMTGLYANEVKYKTGRNLSYDQCMEGESLNQNNTTYTGEITISESTTLYLCGEGIFGDTGMEIEEYTKNSDTTKPNCTISGTEMVLSGGIGTITVECYDTNGILTNQLDSGDLAFNEIDGDVISVGNSTIASETDTSKTFTFTFTGTQVGYSNLALKTGVIMNRMGNTNNYTEGNKIRVVTGENGLHYCHRKAPNPDLIGINETGSMILDCLALSGYEQGEFVEASGDSVIWSLNQVENEQYYKLDYTGDSEGTTYFAISGTIGNVLVQTEPYRSSGITVTDGALNLILDPEDSGWTNQNNIVVHMTGENATIVNYIVTGVNGITIEECMENGTTLNHNGSTFTGEATITNEGITYIYLCGKGADNTSNMLSGTYKIDRTAPFCYIQRASGQVNITNINLYGDIITGDQSNNLSYYRGTNSNYNSVTYIETNQTTFEKTGSINGSGKYYLFVKDEAGNITGCDETFVIYRIKYMIDKVNGTTGTYNTVNYELNSTKPNNNGYFFAVSGEINNMSQMCDSGAVGIPSTLQMMSIGEPNESIATATPGNEVILSNTTYACWYDRNTYQLELVTGTGIASVSGDGTYKYGTSVNISATPENGYTFSSWTTNSGNSPTSPTSANTTVTISGYTKLTANAHMSGDLHLIIDPENSGWTNQNYITVHMTGENATEVRYYVTGANEVEVNQCLADGTLLDNNGSTFTGETTISEEGITYIHLCGIGINGNEIKKGTYKIDRTAPSCIINNNYIATNKIDIYGYLSTGDQINNLSYYRGTSNNSNSVIYILTNSTGFYYQTGLNGSGTYYLFVKDEAGNITGCNETIVAYQVKTMLDNINGTTGNYTTNNYSLDHTNPTATTYYYNVSGNNINLQNLCASSNSNWDMPSTLKATSIGEPSTQAATPVNQANASNTTYACWYDRNTYQLELVTGTGIASVSGDGTYKYGTSVNISATPNNGYTFSNWTTNSGNSPTSPTSASTTVTISGYTKLTANAGDDSNPTVTLTSNGSGACTSGDVYIVTGTFSEAMTGVASGDLQITNGNKIYFNKISDNVYVWKVKSSETGTGITTIKFPAGQATDLAGNPNETSNIITREYDHSGPTFTVDDIVSVPECSTGTTTVTGVTQIGCSSGLRYSWSGGEYGNNSTFSLYSDTTGTENIIVKVKDNLGNYNTGNVTFKWTNVALTANNFIVTGVGNHPKTVNRKTLSNASAGECEIISGSISNNGQGQYGTCEINGENITYTPTANNYTGDDTCNMDITDGDTTKTIEITREGIDTTSLTCQIIEDEACTSGDLLLTLTSNKPINTPNGWTQSINNQIYTKNVNSNNQITVEITDLDGNTGSCTIKPTNYDNTGPMFIFEDKTVDECTRGNLIIARIDDQGGCAGIPNYPYSFDGINWSNTKSWTFSTQATQPGSGTKTGYVRDSLGNRTRLTATWTVNNVLPTANDFSTGNIGNTGKNIGIGQFLDASNAKEGNCVNIDLSFSGVKTNGTLGSCTISRNTLTYTPFSNKTGNDACIITIKDNENSTVDVKVTFTDIDTVHPTVTLTSNGAGTCTSGDVYTITGTFSEAMTGVVSGNLQITNGNRIYFNKISDNVYVWKVKSSETGTGITTIKFPAGQATDLAGNTNTDSNEINRDYDHRGPTGSINITYNGNEEYASGTTLDLSLTASDQGCSSDGPITMQFSCNNDDWSTVEDFTGTKNFELSDYTNAGCTTVDGAKRIYVKYIDSIGNESEVYSDSITVDKESPTLDIRTTNTLKVSSQRMTGTCEGASKYYIGNSTTPTYTNINSNGEYSSGINIENAGTYYVFCQDEAGNTASGSKTYYNYTVYNLLETINGNSGEYNTNNYDTINSGTYLAPRGTRLVLSHIYTIPEGATNTTFKGVSTGILSETPAHVNHSNPTLNGNNTYSMWFARQTFLLELEAGTGINEVNGAGLYKYGKTVNINATVLNGYTWKNWTRESESNSTIFSTDQSTTVTITGDITLKANAKDDTAPVCEIITTNNPNQTGQTATLSGTDGVGITQYYWGTSEPTNNTTYTDITSTPNIDENMPISDTGTYYLSCKDAAGNTSQPQSITYVGYNIQNMLDRVDGTTGEYTTTNYAVDSTKPETDTYYIIPNETSLTLSNLCTIPDEPSTLQATSIGEPGTTPAVNTGTASASNTTYACWYDREMYELELSGDTGIESVSGAGIYKYEKEVPISAIINNGYNFQYWETETGSAPIYPNEVDTTVTVIGYTKLTAHTTDSTKPSCTRGTPSKKDIKSGTTGTITLTCTDNKGIATTALTSNDIDHSGNLIILSDAIVGGNDTNKTFTFTYTGKNGNGITELILKENRIFDNDNNTGVAVPNASIRVDNINPDCIVYAQPSNKMIRSGQQGQIIFKCTSTGSEISTNNLTKSAINYNENVVNLSNATTRTTTNGKLYTFIYTAKADGETTFKLKENQVSDAAGNLNTETEESDVVTVDTLAPTCEISGNPTSWQNTGVTLTLSMADVHIDNSGYRRDNQEFGNITTLYVTENGTHTGYVKDLAGNTGSCSTGVTMIDTSNVTTVITSPEGGTWQTGNFDVSISDTGGMSNLSCYYYINNGEVIERTCNSSTGIDVSNACSGQNGNTCTIIVSAYAVNQAGTTGETDTKTYKIDIAAGSAHVRTPEIYSGNYYNDYFKGTIDIRAQITGANTCEYIINNEERENGTISGNYCLATNITRTKNIIIQFRITTPSSLTFTGGEKTFKYDNTKPKLEQQTEFNNSKDKWYNSDQTSEFQYIDTGAGISGDNTISCLITKEGTESTCSITPNICDHLGNCNKDNVTSKKIKLDKTEPNLKQRTKPLEARYNSKQTINFEYEDKLSGISGDYEKISCEINREGTGLTCEEKNINVCDKAGNCNTKTATSREYNIDMTDPVCGDWSYEPEQGIRTTGSVIGTLNGSYDTLSQINPQYSGGSCTITSENGTCRVTIKDNAGNTTGCTSQIVTWIDRNGPWTGSIQINDGNQSTSSPDVILTLSTEDGNGIGMGYMRFSCDEVEWSSRETYTGTKERNLVTGSGCDSSQREKTVYVQYLDELQNNINNPLTVYDDIMYSTDRPSCTITGTILIMSGSTGTITVHCTDANGITTTHLTGGDIIYSGGIINVGDSNTISEVSESKTFTLTFTGIHAGVSELALRTGAVENDTNGNYSVQGNEINVIDGEGNSTLCSRGEPSKPTIVRFETGYMNLHCLALENTTISTDEINKIIKRSYNKVAGIFESKSGDEYKLLYSGLQVGMTEFAINGTIGNVHISTYPYRSSGITVILNSNIGLYINPQESGWTNTGITVQMRGENTTWLRYITGNNINTLNYDTCSNNGINLENSTGTTNIEEEGITYLYLCGGSTSEKTGYLTGIYKIDTTLPTFDLTGNTELSECQTGTAIIQNASGGLSGLPTNAYSWNGNYGNSGTYRIYKDTTGSQTITGKIKDGAGNVSDEQSITFTWQDVVLTILGDINLGTITGTQIRNNVIEHFHAEAGSCETIGVEVVDSGNATCTLNSNQLTIIPRGNYSGNGYCTIAFTDGDTTKTGTYTFTIDTTEPGGQTGQDELELTLDPKSTNGWTGNYVNVIMTATNASGARYILTGTSGLDINTCKDQGNGLTETDIHTYGKQKYINTTGINYLYLCGESLTGQFKMISGTYMINTETPGGNSGIQLFASNSSAERRTGDIDITLYVDGINITASKYITGNEIKSFEDCMTYGIDFQNSDQITRDTETETTGYLTLCASNQAGKTGYRPFIYKLDKSDPICGTTWTYEPDLDTWTNSGITATLAGSTDDISGIETAGGTCTITENNTTCDVTIRDIAGRTKACTSSGTVNKIDKTKPTLTVIYSNNNTCTSGNVTITLSGSDNNELPEAPYKRDNENNWTGNNTKTVTENTSGTGYIRDIAGNMTQVQYTVTSIVKTGPGKPILTSPTNGQNYTQGNISYSWNESTLAGCANIASYTIKVYSGGNIIISGTTSNTNRNPNITLPNGSYRRKVTAKDSLGFETDSDENTFTINDQAPSCEIGYSTKQITNGDVYAFLKNCSNGATGFNKTGQLFENNGRFEFTFNNGEGITGNARAEVTWIDKVKPECTLTPSNTSLTNSNITLTAEIVEQHPDKYSWTGFNNMDSSIGTLTVTQNGTYRLYLKDRAGNTGSCSIGISNIDKTAPVCGTRQYSPDSLTSGNVEVVLTGSTDDRAINITGGSCTITGKNSRCTITISDRAGNTTGCVSDIVTWIDKTAPILEEVTPVDTPTDDNTPDYTFSSTESGTITYGGSCSSNTTVARSGNNTITFRKLDDGRYTDCTITVTDDAGNVSNTLEVSPFTIKTSTPERDYCPEGDYSDSFYDGTCLGSHKSDEIRDICKVDESNYTNEMKLAYIYSYTYGMTTMCPIDNANLDGKLRRDHLAKILSQYAMNVLDLEPERGKAGCDSYNDIAHESAEMKYYMKTACELGLMGLKSDGDTPMESFYPHGIVTRGEFGTTLSRLIYGDEYNLESEAQNTYEGAWYSRHLAALKRDGIMNEIYGDWPKYFEKRGYVMLMIMRHGKARLDNVGDSKSTIISDSKILSMYNENKELTCEISYFNANENGTGMLYIKNNKIREDLYTNVEGRNSTIYKNDSIYVWGDGVGNGKGISMEYETTAKEELQSLLDEEGYTLKNCKGSVNNNSVFDLPDDIEFIGMGDWFYMLGDYLEGLAGNTTK